MNNNPDKLIRVLTALCCETWLLPPSVHKVLTDIATAHANGGKEELAQHAKAMGMQPKPQSRQFEVYDSTAIIQVQGIIGRKFSEMLYESGVTSSDILDRMIQTAAADDNIDGILIVFDSPGGMAMGTPEVATSIRNAVLRKPVLAYADGLMGSAAYWMASQASMIYATESADVGSIGAYLAITDQHRAAEMQGIKIKLFNGGAKYKGMGYPGTELTKEQESILEQRVTVLSDEFKAKVLGNRTNINLEDMQGQSFGAKDALSKHLIDGIGSMDDALSKLSELKNKRSKR